MHAVVSRILTVILTSAISVALPAQIDWHDARSFAVEGQGFSKTESPFDRLPASARSKVRPAVWKLSRHSAGICVRFRTAATSIHARWSLTSKALAMPHMPATGVSGLDLYVKHEGHWRWLAVGKPTKMLDNQTRLVTGLPAKPREYRLYLPLYNGTAKLSIGVPKGQKIGKGKPPTHPRPLVFYGTSITQGGCASRPGMVHTSILGRQLDRAVINLGFSGNGTMDAAVAELLAELDAAVFIIDCLPNMRAKAVTARTASLVRTIRAKRPKTPILLVEDRSYSNAFLIAGSARRNATSRDALREQFDALCRAKVPALFYLTGARLLGDDGEGTVDGSHPTDLGFTRQAAVFARKLREIIGE